MKPIIVLAALAAMLALTAPAVADTCVASADARKLAGAARTSFLTRCERDAQQACDAQAASRHLAGAAKTSFVTRCVKDATGAP